MKLKVGDCPIVDFNVRSRHAHSAMLFLRYACNIYFPVFVFDRFGVVRKEGRPGQSGKRKKGRAKKSAGSTTAIRGIPALHS